MIAWSRLARMRMGRECLRAHEGEINTAALSVGRLIATLAAEPNECQWFPATQKAFPRGQ